VEEVSTGPEENRHQYGTWDDDSLEGVLLCLGAIWGCSFWFIKLGLRSFSPVDVAFGRLVLGAVTLVVVALVTRTSLPHDRATWGHLFVLALLLNSVPFTLFAFGETRIDAALAGIINGLTPMVTLGVSLLVFRQVHPTAKLLGGLLVGFVGFSL